MSRTSEVQNGSSFEAAVADIDANSRIIARSLAEFVDARVKGDVTKEIAAWHAYITALDERLDSRIKHMVGTMMSGKEISDRLREYQYYESDHLD